MKLEDLCDESLMQVFQGGNQDAFTALYNRYFPSIRSFLRSQITRDQDYAEDVTQEVFIRVNKHKDNFKAGSLFRPWLYSIADRLAYNARRDCTRRTLVMSTDTDIDASLPAAHWSKDAYNESVPGISLTTIGSKDQRERSTEGQMDDEAKLEMLKSLPHLVMELPRDLRRIVQFVLTNGSSLRTAETILGVGRRTLSKQMNQAIAIIRERLDQGEGESSLYTLQDIEEGTIRDLIDSLPVYEGEALERVMFMESKDEADLSILSSVLGKITGHVSSVPVLV